MEGGQTPGSHIAGNTQHPGRTGSSQRIEGIVLAHHSQIQVAVVFIVADHVIAAVIIGNIADMDGVVGFQTKAGVLQTLHGIHGILIITVGQNAGGSDLCELVEGLFNIVQILEIVQMVLLNVQHHSQRGEEVQERVTVFTAFQDDGITLTHPVSSMKQRQITADHDCRILVSFHHDMGHHGSGGGFTVGAGNADGIPVGLHDLAPGLCPLENRNTCCPGGSDFRIVIMCGSRTDDAVRADDVLSAVTDGHINAFGDQFVGRNGCVHIGARNQQAHILKHQAQRAHGNTADANHVHMAARLEEVFYQIALSHEFHSPNDGF